MKKLHIVALSIALAFSLVVFTGASNGPGTFYNTGYTAAPFDGGIYCTACHGGGGFTPVLSMELLDNNSLPVTHYTPGASYTMHLSLSSATGPVNRRYGFQLVPSSSFTSGSGGAWGTFPANVQSVNINGRDYAEHMTPLASGQIYLPWTAPAPGNGNITFYAAGNIVNYNFDASGDNPVSGNLVVMANPLSDKSISLHATDERGTVVLKWSSKAEEVTHYTIERSQNGKQFTQIGALNVQQDNAYKFTDLQPMNSNYYRVVEHARSGTQRFSTTVRIVANDSHKNYHYTTGNSIAVNITSAQEQYVQAYIYSINGLRLSSATMQLGSGVNTLSLEKPALPGMYLICINREHTVLYSSRFVVE